MYAQLLVKQLRLLDEQIEDFIDGHSPELEKDELRTYHNVQRQLSSAVEALEEQIDVNQLEHRDDPPAPREPQLPDTINP